MNWRQRFKTNLPEATSF